MDLRRRSALGTTCAGYYLWTLMDNFEWSAGFAAKYGIAALDPVTLDRIPKSRRRGTATSSRAPPRHAQHCLCSTDVSFELRTTSRLERPIEHRRHARERRPSRIPDRRLEGQRARPRSGRCAGSSVRGSRCRPIAEPSMPTKRNVARNIKAGLLYVLHRAYGDRVVEAHECVEYGQRRSASLGREFHRFR